jgi:hypothetical protein
MRRLRDGADEAVRVEDAASGKLSSEKWASWILNMTVVSSGMTQSPNLIRVFVRRDEPSIVAQVRRNSQIVACRNSDPPASTSSVSRDSSRGWRRKRSPAHANVVPVVS